MNHEMVTCRFLGHRLKFVADGRTMTWHCARCAAGAGHKLYETAAEARRYALAFDRRDTDDLGRRAPLIGLFPLRLWHKFRAARGKPLDTDRHPRASDPRPDEGQS